MNNENVAQEIDRKNEMFIRELMSKESFMLDWYTGAVVPKTHPRYYDERIEVSLRRFFNSSYGNINFGKDEYQVNDKIVNNLYNYIENNIDKLIKISLNQSIEIYEGVSDVIRIKYKSIYLSISGINASSEEEKEDINRIKEDIKNIIINEGVLKENNEINNEQIENAIKEIVGINDIDKNNLLSKLIKKIIEMPVNTDTSIAQLMNSDNNSVAMVEPLIQGEIFNSLMKVCEKLSIKIYVNHDEIGGLGYHYKFKKIN